MTFCYLYSRFISRSITQVNDDLVWASIRGEIGSCFNDNQAQLISFGQLKQAIHNPLLPGNSDRIFRVICLHFGFLEFISQLTALNFISVLFGDIND